jgi:2,4-didehydro-3-deoxy-L-rhamnonate hydrolase
VQVANLKHIENGDQRLAFIAGQGRRYFVHDVADAVGGTFDPVLFDVGSHDWLLPERQSVLADLYDKCGTLDLPPLDGQQWRLAAPVPLPGKIVAIGRNYMDHVREGQEIWKKRGKIIAIPEYPTAFAKFSTSIVGPHDDICLPAGIDDVDYEVELAVFIGRPALNVSVEDALDHVAGYAICNDVAARGIQRREMEAQIGITLAKNFPTFAPMGPWMTAAKAVPDPQKLRISLSVDGEVRQDANTSDMIFPVAKLVSYFSSMGLSTGDILITGTPSGVALAREEPERFYLRAGQVVTARIEGLGELLNPVVQA